jgi:hypothetical protein
MAGVFEILCCPPGEGLGPDKNDQDQENVDSSEDPPDVRNKTQKQNERAHSLQNYHAGGRTVEGPRLQQKSQAHIVRSG